MSNAEKRKEYEIKWYNQYKTLYIIWYLSWLEIAANIRCELMPSELVANIRAVLTLDDSKRQ